MGSRKSFLGGAQALWHTSTHRQHGRDQLQEQTSWSLAKAALLQTPPPAGFHEVGLILGERFRAARFLLCVLPPSKRTRYSPSLMMSKTAAFVPACRRTASNDKLDWICKCADSVTMHMGAAAHQIGISCKQWSTAGRRCRAGGQSDGMLFDRMSRVLRVACPPLSQSAAGGWPDVCGLPYVSRRPR